MAKNKGWVKIHRKITDNVLWMETDPFDKRSAWVDMIMMANHEPRDILNNSSIIHIDVGQFFTSMNSLSSRWHWSEKKVKHFLEILTEFEMVQTEGRTKGTLVTIVNYSKYQNEGRTKERTEDGTEDRAEGGAKGRQTRMIENDTSTITQENKKTASPDSLSLDGRGFIIEE